jgi:ectoine hydroxylase
MIQSTFREDSMGEFELTLDQIADFDDDGFFIVEGLLDTEEVDLLRDIARADQALVAGAASRADGEGGAVKVRVDNELGENDIYSAIVRSRRIIEVMESLLCDEVYHYHHKMILKEPRVGGAWAWHQDYGYWYDNGCLFPYLSSCMIAVDRATKQNGCLQVLRGSHHIGRVNHVKIGDQTGADPERVAVAIEGLELVHCELEPGSAIFFHCNLLHRSDQNTSDDPRWAFISCYNTKGNDPYKESRHPRYSPLAKWPDSMVLEIGRRQWARMQQPVA